MGSQNMDDENSTMPWNMGITYYQILIPVPILKDPPKKHGILGIKTTYFGTNGFQGALNTTVQTCRHLHVSARQTGTWQ